MGVEGCIKTRQTKPHLERQAKLFVRIRLRFNTPGLCAAAAAADVLRLWATNRAARPCFPPHEEEVVAER